MAAEVAAAQRRIIRRPRLTSILDKSTAQIRILIAPAGFGKTTLAREWLDVPNRRDVWYRGGPASADVAALSAGIAEAASEIIPEAGKRMRDRLRATGQPEEDVAILAELFAEDVQDWPSNVWLAFDDYQFAMESLASERFVDLLTQETPMQMLVTSRRRPSWATARRILYGEILEIDRRALAMEDAEARAVLGRDDRATQELITRAKGWPAVLGLAAMTEDFVLPPEDLPATLHAYFAEEVFQAADPTTLMDLAGLAIAPVISRQLVSAICGEARSRKVIETGVRLGILTNQDTETFSIHPLLRELLQAQFSDQPKINDHASRIGQYFVRLEQWDHAFEVASLASIRPLLERTIELGLDPLLSSGRLATIQRWVDYALNSHLDIPIVDLAESELAFRQGEHDRAYILASQAAVRFKDADLASRAHVRAGHSALFSSREDEGLQHFRSASALAHTWERRREALVGLYFAASELGARDAAAALEELETSEEHTSDWILRLEVLRLMRAARVGGGVSEAVQVALPKLHLVNRATDPLGVTAFLHTLATTLNLTARYAEALELIEQQLAFASRYRLDFPIVHARLNKAISQLGLGNFQESAEALDEFSQLVPASGDAYLEATRRAIECRLLTSKRQFKDAIALTEDEGETISSPPLRAEYLSSRALALACQGESVAARRLVQKATATRASRSSIEARVLSRCVDAVIALRDTNELGQRRAALKGWRAALETGNFDSFVCSYRAEPRMLTALVQEQACRSEVAELLTRAHDHEMGRQLGLFVRRTRSRRTDSLTARELDVLRELEQGFSNKDIADRLFVTEGTVKVHLRHIYEKLGVRTRTQLLAKRARQR
jgi:LuxR family transcriptional regulator, maltose regulon positive regulatory protein